MPELIIPPGAGQLVYCATPSRLSHQAEAICEFVDRIGYAPLQPLIALPRKHFEGNINVGREKTLEHCERLIEICEEFWLFGISEGTVREFLKANDLNKPIRLIKKFDGDWECKAIELNAADMLRRFPLHHE